MIDRVSMREFMQCYRPWCMSAVMSAACALHWFCVNHHVGQGSALYALQCRLKYSPGVREYGVESGTIDEEIYDALAHGELDPSDVYAWITDRISEQES